MQTLRLKPLPGFEPIQKFIEAVIPSLPSNINYQFRIDTSFRDGHLNLATNPGTFANQAQELKPLFETRPMARCTYVGFTYNNATVEYNCSDPLVATIQMNQIANIGDVKFVALFDSIYQNFDLLRPEEIGFGNLPPAEQKQLRAYERALTDLTAQTAKLGELAGNIAEKQADYFRERSEKMDEELRSEREELRKAHETKIKEVAAKDEALNDRIKQLDLQEHKTARRALAVTTRTAIEALKSPEARHVTNLQEVLIHAVSMIVIISGGILLGRSVTGIIASDGLRITSIGTTLPDFKPEQLSTEYLPLIGLTILVGSTLFFYLRFLSLWAERNTLYRRNKEKYAIDFNRADWLTELVFEYAEQNKEFPPEVMARLSQGLFMDSSWEKRNLHPGDDIIDFVNRITKLKVTKEGPEIEMQDSEAEKKDGQSKLRRR